MTPKNKFLKKLLDNGYIVLFIIAIIFIGIGLLFALTYTSSTLGAIFLALGLITTIISLNLTRSK